MTVRIGVLIGALLLPTTAWASTILIGSTTYQEAELTEQIDAPFTTPDAGVSVLDYFGFVKVVVWGVGESRGTQMNDAFYVFTDSSRGAITPFYHDCSQPMSQGWFCADPRGYYELAFATVPLVPFDPMQSVLSAIIHDLDAGQPVAPWTVPAFRPDHTYSFIIDTGLVAPGALRFGVSDGIFSDNSGSYHLQLTQMHPVVPVPMPEPGALLLVGSGLALMISRRRRRA